MLFGWRPPRLPLATFWLHPLEVSLGALFALIGLLLFVTGFDVRVSGVQLLPMPIVVAWTTLIGIGGMAMVAGLSWRGQDHIGRAVERLGLFCAEAAWLVYVISILYVAPGQSVLGAGFGIALSVGLHGRAVALTRVDRVVEHVDAVARSAGEAP